MASDQILAEFRMRVAMLRRQRWLQVEYSEDPPVALLFADADTQERVGGRRFSARSGARQPTWRKVWVNDAGRVMQENVPPPEEAEQEAAVEAPEETEAPAEQAPVNGAAKPKKARTTTPKPAEETPAPARRRKKASETDVT